MTPQEIRELAGRLRAQAQAVFIRGEAGHKASVAADIAEWYTAKLQVLADQQAEAAASDIKDLDEMLVVRLLSPRGESETLRQAIDRIINWEVAVNLDPAVSSSARELIERGRKEAEAEGVGASGEVGAAVRREADAWREVLEIERLRVASVEGRYWALLRRLASLSMVSMPAPRVVVDAERLQPDDELGRVLAARGWL